MIQGRYVKGLGYCNEAGDNTDFPPVYSSYFYRGLVAIGSDWTSGDDHDSSRSPHDRKMVQGRHVQGQGYYNGSGDSKKNSPLFILLIFIAAK